MKEENKKYIITESGKLLDLSAVCSVCLECTHFNHCASKNPEQVLPESNCVEVLHNFGCAGECRGCYEEIEEEEYD